eukprot:TRINITY_DN6993_c0_g1_i6.p1 TRINITY_DN6993_c0_g1~~TRINITY_DN6993_c0_g1_i6.p1  ORF type:complete len:200 (-),score=45.93 TRINITY_DN6993_c0_g1_i6:104-703(-)
METDDVPPDDGAYEPPKQSNASSNNNTNSNGTSLIGPFKCENITERILSALIEENIVTFSNDNSIEQDSTSSSFSISPNIPPVADYSHATMVQLEERIKQELISIGLLQLENVVTENTKEDDEICRELRRLQAQLKNHLASTAAQRKQIHQVVIDKAQEQKHIKEQLEMYHTEEQQILKKLSKAKRKRKNAVLGKKVDQ